MLNRLLMTALLAALVTGAVATIVQMLWAVPLIHAAEVFETAAPTGSEQPLAAEAGHRHDHGHDHSGHAEWAPADGFERTFWTFVTNLALSLGVSLILCGLFLLRGRGTVLTGLRWGLFGYLAFALAPALGLPPELPGTEAAALADRQGWWLLTAGCTLGAIILAATRRRWWATAVALVIAAVPHLVGAPHPESHGALAPAALQQEFIVASLVSMLVFWLVAGGVSGALFQRFLSADVGDGPIDPAADGALPS